jgi:hypothetical protein
VCEWDITRAAKCENSSSSLDSELPGWDFVDSAGVDGQRNLQDLMLLKQRSLSPFITLLHNSRTGFDLNEVQES